MTFLLVAAAVLTLATLILAGLWRLVLRVRRRAAPRFWIRTLKTHACLFAVHLFVTVPCVLAMMITTRVGTRGDERRYSGPRLSEDGTWLLQTREGLEAETKGTAKVAPEVEAAARARAVSFVARDGVKLRGFLVPPVAGLAADGPRFVAVLVHGLFRGAMEIETPGSMLRELGGEVLLLEQRNHGGSGRALPTFGRDESLDVLAAVDFLRSRPEARDRPLVLYGVSIGTGPIAIAAPQVPTLSGLVLDAPMDDLPSLARRALGSGPFWQSFHEPWISSILLFAWLRGVPMTGVRPREALARLPPRLPVLFIGAGHDDRMPPDTVRALFASLPTLPDRKDLWIEPEASHGKVWVKAPDEYRRRLGHLIDEAMGDPAR